MGSAIQKRVRANTQPTAAGIIVEAMVKWFGLGVIVGALPVIFNAIDFAFRREAFSPTAVLRHGELFLLSVALVAASICELPMKSLEGKAAIARTSLLVATVVLILIGTVCFVEVSSLVEDSRQYDAPLVAYGSLILFLLAIITAGSCLALGKAVSLPNPLVAAPTPGQPSGSD